MAESERRQRLITSTPHVTPEEVLQRTFSTSFRGYSESEVRAFLQRVSDELAAQSDREAELLQTIDTLEEQVRVPRPLSEPELLDALGAETSRLLRSAREAADEIRTKAEDRSTALLDEANAEAERVRNESDELLRARTREGETRAADLVGEAEERAAEIQSAADVHSEEQHLRAEREADALVESARQQGRDMLDEAKATRERVLADLLRRRGLLQAQIDELRSGRDNLLDAYRVVKRTFLEATEALAQVEARAAAERAAPPDGSGEPGSADVVADAPAPAGDALPAASVGTSAGDALDDGPDPTLADVDSLFARIRAGQTEAVPEAVPPVADAEPAAETVDLTESEASEAAVPEPEVPEPAVGAPPTAVDVWRAQRADVIDPLLARVAKRAKRAAQDDQNALLDAVRRHKGRPTAAQVLKPEPELLTAWVGVIREEVDEAYWAGRIAVGGAESAADDELARECAAAIVLPLRARIAAAIDDGDDGDPGGLVERIGARFREWKNQSLENALADVLALVWSRGVYDAAPDGAVLRWIPLVEGRCSDCDDNGLEPTVKGSTFPTGQPHPPAHPGCRCLLAPSDVLSRLTANA